MAIKPGPSSWIVVALRTCPWEQKVDELFCAPLEKNKKKRKVKKDTQMN
jgi:hypothetical protein